MTTAKLSVAQITGVHPYAEKFPMLPEGELGEMAASIAANGLRNPIVVTPKGLILDGRNRAEACRLAHVDPETVVYTDDDLAEYVIDCNSTRRNMSTGARAMATALVLADAIGREGGKWKYGAVAKAKRSESGTSVSQWSQRLAEAGTVIDHAADLAQQVVDGDLALDAAYRQAVDRRDADRRKLNEEKRLAAEEADAKAFIEENAPDLAAQVGKDNFPFQSFIEARDVWNRRNREEAERLRREKEAAAKKATEHAEAMTDLYSGIARGLQICGGYGGYNDIVNLMAEYRVDYLDPVQYEREFEIQNLSDVKRFAEMLIDWQESRNA